LSNVAPASEVGGWCETRLNFDQKIDRTEKYILPSGNSRDGKYNFFKRRKKKLKNLSIGKNKQVCLCPIAIRSYNSHICVKYFNTTELVLNDNKRKIKLVIIWFVGYVSRKVFSDRTSVSIRSWNFFYYSYRYGSFFSLKKMFTIFPSMYGILHTSSYFISHFIRALKYSSSKYMR